MSEMPSIEQVMSLPKRAIVAYLARCARRLRPTMDRSEKRPDPMPGGWMELFEARNREAAAGVKWERVTAMLDRAIEYAEAVAGGGNAKKADRRFNASVRRATDSGAAAARAQLGPQGSGSVFLLAASAGSVAKSVAESGFNDFDVRIGYRSGQEAAAKAGLMSQYAAATRHDYDRLRAICKQAFPQLGDPIDPSERGPLGPLWRQGEG